MDAPQIKALLESSGEELAFVPERSSKATLAEALSALANASGGTVLLGVTRAGSIRGVREPDAQCERALAAALLADPPLVLPLPDQVQLDGRTVVVVRVPAGLPNVYRLGERYLVRDGAEDRPLKPSEVHQLMAQRGVARFETLTPSGAALGDLDWDKVRQYVNRLQRLQGAEAESVLHYRGCLSEDAGDRSPTYAGLLLFGRTPAQWVTSAEIVAVRYPGLEMGDQFVRQDIGGPLADQILGTEAFLQANTSQEIALDGLTREEQPSYPPDVLREVVVNAVAHREYAQDGESIRALVFADRIEVYSPGRLPGHITVENIVRERFSRNPAIVQVLADMGFIERLGYGIDRMLRLLEEAGHPPPLFEETTAGFRVTLYARSAAPPAQRSRWPHLELNARQEEAVHYVIAQGRITNREYQTLCPDVSAETIRRDLSDLVHQDVLLRIGRKRATYYILKDASLAN